ncbi:GDSL-type esterase/lipase family protein [Haploplasma axanthum]|nr:GDSL-type esterase/lipase family protein [Haploplasma axanthum]
MLEAVMKSDYVRSVKLFEQEKISERSIVLLGDSIIKYWPFDKFYSNLNIINRGIPGDTSLGVLQRLEQIIKIKPSVVIISVGSNDLVRLDSNINDIAKRIIDIKHTLEREVEDLSAYVVSITPVLRDHVVTNKAYMQTRTNEMINAINNELKNFIEVIDVSSALKDESGSLKLEYTTDGLHLTNQGYQVYSRIISESVKELKYKGDKKNEE